MLESDASTHLSSRVSPSPFALSPVRRRVLLVSPFVTCSAPVCFSDDVIATTTFEVSGYGARRTTRQTGIAFYQRRSLRAIVTGSAISQTMLLR